MKKIITEIVLVPEHHEKPSVFSEGAIILRLMDEGGGPFLSIRGNDSPPSECVNLDFSEVDAVFAACKWLEGVNNWPT